MGRIAGQGRRSKVATTKKKSDFCETFEELLKESFGTILLPKCREQTASVLRTVIQVDKTGFETDNRLQLIAE